MEEKEIICFFSDTIFRIDVLGQSVGCLFFDSVDNLSQDACI